MTTTMTETLRNAVKTTTTRTPRTAPPLRSTPTPPAPLPTSGAPFPTAPDWYQPDRKPISSKLAQSLAQLGFRALLLGLKRTAAQVLVRLENGIVSDVSPRDVKDALRGTLDALPACVPDAYEDINTLTQADIARLRDQLPLLSPRPLRRASLFTPTTDTSEEARFFFHNGTVCVTADQITLKPTAEVGADGYIWEHEVVPRAYSSPTDPSPGLYERFVTRAFYHQTRTDRADWRDNFELTDDGAAHYHAFRACVGYLLHAYRDAANSRAIIFVDADSDNIGANGGTGKSLVSRSLAHLRSLAPQDGRRFSQAKHGGGRFQFSNVKPDTRIVLIDDVQPHFQFEDLFTMLTGDMEVEEKGKNKMVIPAERAPKFVITSNYILPQRGISFQRRQYLVEFGSYWSTAARRGEFVTDSQHLGTRLFDGFTETDWNQFYSYLFGCVQQYLREGVTPPPSQPRQLRALRAELGESFADWAESLFDQYPTRRVSPDKGDYLDDLKAAFAVRHPDAPPMESFQTHLMRAAEFFGWEYNAHKSHMGTTPTARRWRISDATGDKRDAVIFTRKA
jgi:hypothetical protein